MKTITFECTDGVYSFSLNILTLENADKFCKKHQIVNVYYY